MAGFWAAYRAARDQQKKVRDYENFRSQPMSERLLEHVQHVCDRTGAPIVVHLKTGDVIEFKPQRKPETTRWKGKLAKEGVDLDEVLQDMMERLSGREGVGF